MKNKIKKERNLRVSSSHLSCLVPDNGGCMLTRRCGGGSESRCEKITGARNISRPEPLVVVIVVGGGCGGSGG
jgi:hypothetical protein